MSLFYGCACDECGVTITKPLLELPPSGRMWPSDWRAHDPHAFRHTCPRCQEIARLSDLLAAEWSELTRRAAEGKQV